jgi:hypothetical protein
MRARKTKRPKDISNAHPLRQLLRQLHDQLHSSSTRQLRSQLRSQLHSKVERAATPRNSMCCKALHIPGVPLVFQPDACFSSRQ